MMSERNNSEPLDLDLKETRLPFEVRFPSEERYIERIVEIVSRRCAELSFPPKACTFNVPVALSEALANAIRYGNDGDANKRVRVRASIVDRSLVLEVADEGPGFDLDACTVDPTSPANIEREDGRGLYLMRLLMDRVERFTDGGNVIRLTLHRT
jgi:serine/threonine-protein kinase RsbW